MEFETQWQKNLRETIEYMDNKPSVPPVLKKRNFSQTEHFEQTLLQNSPFLNKREKK